MTLSSSYIVHVGPVNAGGKAERLYAAVGLDQLVFSLVFLFSLQLSRLPVIVSRFFSTFASFSLERAHSFPILLKLACWLTSDRLTSRHG